MGKRSRPCKFGEINESLYKWYYKWYSLATTHNIYPAGPQLNYFKESSGWLDRWKKQYDVHKMQSSDVSQLHGKRGFLSSLENILLKISGIWTKLGVFGVLCQNMVSEGISMQGRKKRLKIYNLLKLLMLQVGVCDGYLESKMF